MSFIGIFTTKKEYEYISKIINKNFNDIKLIHINNQSINNILNIRFETIIIDKNITTNNKEKINRLLRNSRYLVINSDIELTELTDLKLIIIDYGLNQKSTVTVSSINNEEIIISLQRNIKNVKGKRFEINEEKIKLDKNKRIYTQLIIYILKMLYN